MAGMMLRAMLRMARMVRLGGLRRSGGSKSQRDGGDEKRLHVMIS
jgi:hypothetical protein